MTSHAMGSNERLYPIDGLILNDAPVTTTSTQTTKQTSAPNPTATVSAGANQFAPGIGRYWHLADISDVRSHVCFWGQSGHSEDPTILSLMTQSGHFLSAPLPMRRFQR